MAKNFYLDNDDLRFNIENQDWHELFPLIETDPKDQSAPKNADESKVLYHEFLTSLGEYIAEKIDPKAHNLDMENPTLVNGEMQDSPTMKQFIKGLADMGAMAMPFPRHVGGFNLPWLVANAACEMIARADVSLMTYYGFFSGIGMALNFFALEEGSFEIKDGQVVNTRFDAAMKELCEAKSCGAMCLTEPQAGSDLGQISTIAKKSDDGYWYLTGQKIWITCGHGEHHLVLARSEKAETSPGLKGLSLFYMPAHIEKNGQRVRNFTIGGQEKKMGQHSSVTVTLHYDESRAELVGKRGHGFRNMTLVMNDARLLVGFEGIGLCEKALRLSKDYANDRVSMGKKISEHEMIADYLDDMELNNKALRCLAFTAGFNEEMANRIKAFIKVNKKVLDDKQLEAYDEKLKYYKWQARLSTPLVKYAASENAVYFARMSMQILGGNGYMSEYGAEKLMRDALILPIYEGTSQIQSLMVLKDHLQFAMRNPGKFLSKMAQAKMSSLTAKTKSERKLAKLTQIYYSTVQLILTKIVTDKFGDLKDKALTSWKEAFLKTWDPKKDFSFGLLNAERFCLIASRLWMAKSLVKQAMKIQDEDLKNQRLELALRFMRRAESKMKGWFYEIEASKSASFRQSFLKNDLGSDFAE